MFDVKVRGIPEFKAALADVSKQLRRKLLSDALRAGARQVQGAARAAAPVLNPSSLKVRRGVRSSGTLKKAIVVRANPEARKLGNVGISVVIRAPKGAARGKNSPKDPYYAPWVEFGHKIVGRFKGAYASLPIRGRGRKTGIAKRRRSPLGFVRARPFMRPAATLLPKALSIFTNKLSAELNKLNSRRV